MSVNRLSFMPVGRIAAIWWAPVALALMAIDYLTGPYYQFPAVYIVPVMLAAWFSGFGAGLVLALVLPLSRFVLMLSVWGEPWDASTILATSITRGSVFVVMALMAARLAQHERVLTQENIALRSLLPICNDCRKIRSGSDHWEPLETYVSNRKDEFPTGLCPDCFRTRLPEHFPPA